MPDVQAFVGHSVDRHSSILGSTLIFTTPETTVRFYPALNVASKTCKHLIEERKSVRCRIKQLRSMGVPQDVFKADSLEHLQYSYKIVSNSLYGCMAFKAYNTYNPRCSMTITGGGRWALNVA